MDSATEEKDCSLHLNGKCTVMGVACLSVNVNICHALRAAYNFGTMKSDLADQLLPCPFCGGTVSLQKKPLWLKDGYGYPGCYFFDIRCTNPKCGCTVNLIENDTIYRTEEEARENAIKAWNRRAGDDE